VRQPLRSKRAPFRRNARGEIDRTTL